MVKEDIIADAVVETLVTKLKAMEKVDKGFLSSTSVTVVDRVAVILGTFRKEYHDKILSTKEGKEDIDKALSLIKKYGLDVGNEEVVLLGKVRRFVAEKLKSHGLSLFMDKVVDVEDKKQAARRNVSFVNT